MDKTLATLQMQGKLSRSECSSIHANSVNRMEVEDIWVDDKQGKFDEFADVINQFLCFFPHFSREEIGVKLQLNGIDIEYKAKLLQECIASSLDDGFDICEDIFLTLEEWQNEGSAQLLSEKNERNTEGSSKTSGLVTQGCKTINGEESEILWDKDVSSFDKEVSFLSEVIPGFNEQKIKQELIKCSSLEGHRIISRYLENLDILSSENEKTDKDTSLPCESKRNGALDQVIILEEKIKTRINHNTRDFSDVFVTAVSQSQIENCESSSSFSRISPPVINIDEDTKSPASNVSDVVVVEELSNFNSKASDINNEFAHQLFNSVDLPQSSNLDGSTNEQCSDRLNLFSDMKSPGSPLNIIESNEVITISEESSSKDSDDAVESKQLVKGEDALPFKDEDIKHLEGATSDSSPQEVPYESDTESLETVGENLEFKEDTTSNSLEDTESDELTWKEAQAICKLLPFLHLQSIHQSILDNYYHPQRKSKVLTEYIELAIEEGHEVTAKVFAKLYKWQAVGKRNYISKENSVKEGSKLKKMRLESPQPTTSTSILPQDQEKTLTQLNFNSYLDENQLAYFNSLTVEKQLWYYQKIEFLYEIAPHLSKQHILSQIINCETEDDIMRVSVKILEEMDSVNQHDPVQPESLPVTGPQEIVNLEPLVIMGVNDPGPSALPQEADQPNSNQNDSSQPLPYSDDQMPSTSDQDESASQISAADIEDRIQSHIQQLGEMFSDADPDFLCERATEVGGDQEKYVQLVVELTEKRSYPKMEDYLKRQHHMNMRKKFIEGMTVEEFMEYFDDPEKIFCDSTKVMTGEYMRNARTQLNQDFPFHLSKTIEAIFRKNNYHYLPTLRALKLEPGARKTKRPMGGKQPSDLDDVFLKELCYAKMEEKINEHFKQKEIDRAVSFEAAKANGELLECQCCFDDEVLRTDMSTCENLDIVHLFCNTCIRRYAEEQIGQGKLEFVCMEGECGSPFSLNTLKKLLKASVFSNLLKRKQTAEIEAAGIEDLESCPFCTFATIMPNKEDKVFKCQNRECLKDSCRLCKELNHVPLRCEEVEKQKQTDARTFLENEMTEAMVRECYKCKKRFIKEEGCNKMVCSCGAMMCYLCRQPIKGYDHFDNNDRGISIANSNKCPLYSNSLQLHAEEVQERAAKAKEQLDPSVELLHDPTKDLPQVPDYLKKTKPAIVPAAPEPRRPNIPPVNLGRLINAYLLKPFQPVRLGAVMEGNLNRQQHGGGTVIGPHNHHPHGEGSIAGPQNHHPHGDIPIAGPHNHHPQADIVRQPPANRQGHVFHRHKFQPYTINLTGPPPAHLLCPQQAHIPQPLPPTHLPRPPPAHQHNYQRPHSFRHPYGAIYRPRSRVAVQPQYTGPGPIYARPQIQAPGNTGQNFAGADQAQGALQRAPVFNLPSYNCRQPE